jgi:large subunit ribosomal protein L1
MKKRSKRYSQSIKKVEKDKTFTLKEALLVLKSFDQPKFDGACDLHFHLNVDPKKSDQMVRGTVALPHGTGKKVRVAVFCKGEQERAAKEAHAEFFGGTELIEKVAGGFLDFDCAIATPDMMKDLSRLGKILGPRGLMPSPKTGTVTQDVAKAIDEVKKGKVEFRVDKQGGMHLSVGKISFTPEQLYENASRVIEAITEAKPASVKGKFVKTLFISTSMNPALRINV